MLALAESLGDLHVDVDIVPLGRSPSCVMTLRSSTDVKLWANISAMGSGWYELAVNGGFWTGRADDRAVDTDEVREYLASYVRAALAYLEGSWSIRKSRFLKVPTLTIQKGGSVLNLVPRGRGTTNDHRLSF